MQQILILLVCVCLKRQSNHRAQRLSPHVVTNVNPENEASNTILALRTLNIPRLESLDGDGL